MLCSNISDFLGTYMCILMVKFLQGKSWRSITKCEHKYHQSQQFQETQPTEEATLQQNINILHNLTRKFNYK